MKEYQRKILDRASDKVIDLLVSILSAIRPGWKDRNRSRISEWKLMLYALNRSPIGLRDY